jgi:hypothetical protein
LISAQGEVSDFLYAFGPARKGSLWETIAVPELRVQVSERYRQLCVRDPDVFLLLPAIPCLSVFGWYPASNQVVVRRGDVLARNARSLHLCAFAIVP